MDKVELIINLVLSVAAAFGGGVGWYFWKENKALKKEEVKQSQVDTEAKKQDVWSKQNEELQHYIEMLKSDNAELKEENKKKDTAMEEMRNTLNDVVKRVGVLEVQVERAESFRCDNLGCPNRQPPLKCHLAKGNTDPACE